MKKPSLFARIFPGLKKKATTFFGLGDRFTGSENALDSANLRSYRDSLYLFIGVSMIRETVSSIPLEMYEIVNRNGDVNEITDDPYLDLMERPNAAQTQKEFWKLAVAYYLLAGETFWYMEHENGSAIPTAMVNMRPDHVTIVLSADKKTILNYEFSQEDGTILKILPENVLHIKNIDPINTLRGVGVIRPASARIITEKEASKHQSMTFKNQGRPDIAVFTDVDLKEEDATDAREKWAKVYGGDKGSQAGFFGNKIKDIKMLNVSPKDMDFIASMKFLRDDILAALRIPKAMITSDDVNLANANTANIVYYKQACLPVLDTFIDVFNNKFLADQDQNRFVTYENPVNEDRDMLLKESTQLKQAGIITVNEARDLMHYTPMDGEDQLAPSQAPTLQMSMKMARVKKLARRLMKKRPILVKKFKAIEAMTEVYEAEKRAVKRTKQPVFATQDQKNMYVKAFHKNIDDKAVVFKNSIDIYNEGFQKRIVAHLEKFGVDATRFFDVSHEIVTAKGIFNPLMKSLFEKTGQQTLDNVATGFAQKASESFYTSQSMLQALEHRAEFFIGSMLSTDYDELKAIIASAMKEGKGVDAIGRDLRAYFEHMSVARAKTIARTETGRLVSQATNEAYKQSAVVTGKEWLTAEDDRVRDEHRANDGVVVSADGEFPSGEHYPGENSINCRCALAPAV